MRNINIFAGYASYACHADIIQLAEAHYEMASKESTFYQLFSASFKTLQLVQKFHERVGPVEDDGSRLNLDYSVASYAICLFSIH